MDPMQTAAAARALAVRSSADRPSQRRSAEDADGPRAAITRSALTLTQRAMEGPATAGMTFEGLASRTETPYRMYDSFGEYDEVIGAGAFARSLAREGLDVPLVLEHKEMRRIARTLIPEGQLGHLALAETADGLHCMAELDPADPDVAYIAVKLQSGLVDEMSFRFRITAGEWSPDFTAYRITEVDLHRGDVAIVAYGANPHTNAAMYDKPRPKTKRSFTVTDEDLA